MVPVSDSVVPPVDWQALNGLANAAGFPVERIALMQRQLTVTPVRNEGWLTLLAGQSAVVDLFISRWLSPDAVDALRAAGAGPAVFGRRPARDLAGACPQLRAELLADGHLVVVRGPAVSVHEAQTQLAPLGVLDHLVFVTRLGQPLSSSECGLLRALVGHVARVHVLIVAVPGEEVEENEMAELLAYAKARVRSSGFSFRQYAGASIWYTAGDIRPGTLVDPAAIMAPAVVDATDRELVIRQAIAGLLRDLGSYVAQAPQAAKAVAIDSEDKARLQRELGIYLEDLGRTVTRELAKHPEIDAARLRTEVLSRLESWGQVPSVEQMWVRYLDRVRPGTWAALLRQAEANLAELSIDVEQPISHETVMPVVDTWQSRALLEARRGAVGLTAGIGAYLTAGALFTAAPLVRDFVLPPIGALLGVPILLVASVFGYGLGHRLIRPDAAPASSNEAGQRTLAGWTTLANRLQTELGHQLNQQEPSIHEEYQRFVTLYTYEEN